MTKRNRDWMWWCLVLAGLVTYALVVAGCQPMPDDRNDGTATVVSTQPPGARCQQTLDCVTEDGNYNINDAAYCLAFVDTTGQDTGHYCASVTWRPAAGQPNGIVRAYWKRSDIALGGHVLCEGPAAHATAIYQAGETLCGNMVLP